MTDLNERIDELVERAMTTEVKSWWDYDDCLRHGIEIGLRERALPDEVTELVEAVREGIDYGPHGGCLCEQCDRERKALAAVEALLERGV